MNNITIGRYRTGECVATRIHCDADAAEVSREEFQPHAGWIEGVRDDESTWIMYLDAEGSPRCFWARRELDGGVIGEPTLLAP